MALRHQTWCFEQKYFVVRSDERIKARNVSFIETLYGGQLTLSTQLLQQPNNFFCLVHRKYQQSLQSRTLVEDKTHLQNRTQTGKRNETVNNPSSEERLVVKLGCPEKAQYITIPLSDSWRPLSILWIYENHICELRIKKWMWERSSQ